MAFPTVSGQGKVCPPSSSPEKKVAIEKQAAASILTCFRNVSYPFSYLSCLKTRCTLHTVQYGNDEPFFPLQSSWLAKLSCIPHPETDF